ncbi:MAG: hypothetical protein DRI44_03905 [Chlamydiae bacterium]|nr:MAG: hypothetical protein DRI44_03905 [Chlamydiota bacterium]
MKKITLLSAMLIPLLAIQFSFAAPSLTIIKPPVTPNPSYTGPGSPPMPPPGDPHAIYGQWFVDKLSGTIYTNRTHEFYDNVDPGWGGGYASCGAINGFVISVSWGGPGTPITAFDIMATITNDIPANSPWMAGSNSHNENRAFNSLEDQKFEGSLLDVKLTAEFAVDAALSYFPPNWIPPYVNPYSVNIEAINHDELAWYCWTDDPESPDPTNPGNFFVPTWDLGNIPQGGFASVLMQFQIPPGLLPSDPRYDVITNSLMTEADILLNRTTSLKISEWVEGIYTDTGIPYPDHPEGGSDVSVFHSIPEPGIFIGIWIGILGLYSKFEK